MIPKLSLLVPLIFLSIYGKTQLNDTIFYKSGVIKIVEISSFDEEKIVYSVSKSASASKLVVKMITVASFKMYDDDGLLTYSSGPAPTPAKTEPVASAENIPEPTPAPTEDGPRELTVSKHTLSLNPFLLPFLSANFKYNYTFGNKMQYSVTARATYLSEVLSDFNFNGDLLLGVGIRLTPFYVKHFAFGVDFTPMVGLDVNNSTLNNGPQYLFPLNLNFDFFVNQKFGFTFDVGAGTKFRNQSYDYMARVHFGILLQFKNKKVFTTTSY